MPFQDRHTTPTSVQFALLGQAVTEWGIIDYLMTVVLARLAGSPDFTGLALVERLSFPSRIRAMTNLIDMHHRRYGLRKLSQETLATATYLAKRLDAEKPKRNKIAHQIWIRSTDDSLIHVTLEGRQAPERPPPDATLTMTNSELTKDVESAGELRELVEALIQLLPEVPEMPEQQ